MNDEEKMEIINALLVLAGHVERCPFNEYKVREEVLDALQLEIIKPAPTGSRKKK